MPAATYIGNSTINIVESSQRPPAPGEVQIDVAFTGICGTDLHILHGNMDARVTLPCDLRPRDVRPHRSSSATASAAGTSATPSPSCRWTGDGDCPACLAGQSAHLPEPELHRHRLARRAAEALERAGDHPRPAAGGPRAWIAPPWSNPSRSPSTTSAAPRSQPGDKAVVIGGGPIGVLIATVARHAGAEVVVHRARRATGAP